jgi:hypothetical protein
MIVLSDFEQGLREIRRSFLWSILPCDVFLQSSPLGICAAMSLERCLNHRRSCFQEKPFLHSISSFWEKILSKRVTDSLNSLGVTFSLTYHILISLFVDGHFAQ